MNGLWIASACFLALWLGYRFYGRLVASHVYGAGSFPDEGMPSRHLYDGRDFVPTRRGVLLSHHFVTIAGAGPIVGPAVAVTWGWLPALLWIVLGTVLIGAVHDLGALVASVRNQGRTVGDLAADILTPRVRLLFLAFIFLALWIVLAVFAFVIASLFVAIPQSVPAIWLELPLAVLVGVMILRRGGSLLRWSLFALVMMYAFIALGMQPAVAAVFDGFGIVFWLGALFVYAYLASVLPVQSLLQPRDLINAHQLFAALGLLAVGLFTAALTASPALEVVAPAVNQQLPAGAPLLFPFLFITIACGAVSGFHCMVASGTTARQLASERDARSIGFGGMVLEGGLAVLVVLCCVTAAGFADRAAWDAKYSVAWVDRLGFVDKLEGLIVGGAAYMGEALGVVGIGGFAIETFLQVALTVVIISFAATTMDSATRIQRYVVGELAGAVRLGFFQRPHPATAVAVGTAAALAICAGTGGTGGLALWPVFGVANQLLACLTLLVISTWLAKRGRTVAFTVPPMLFLIVIVSWAAVVQLVQFAQQPADNWHLITVLAVGLVLEGWMFVEGVAAWRLAGRLRGERAKLSEAELESAWLARGGAAIGPDGVVRRPPGSGTSGERQVGC